MATSIIGSVTGEPAPYRSIRETGAYLAAAARVIPGGASAAGRRVFQDVIVRAQGAYLWNADGKRFIDYLLSYGPIVVGHCDPRINGAVARAIETCDLNWVGPQTNEVELAQTIVDLIPSAERVAFVVSGSDALTHAVHVARAATGRRKLLKFHGQFLGWHDQLAVGANFEVGPLGPPGPNEPNAGGVNPSVIDDVIVLEWNDFDALRSAFASHGHSLALAGCEPYVLSYGCVPPAPGFLEELRALCTMHGVVLLFDEVKTGFRLNLGGYQSVIGVMPDLTALGKSIANGFTIGALAGRADLMDLLGTKVALDGTHYANPYALAAARATIDVLSDGGMERLATLGEALREGLTRAVADTGVRVTITGIGSGFMINWRDEAPVTFRQAADADFERAESFRKLMLDAGILLPPFVITDSRLCLATSEPDIDATVEAARWAFGKVK